MKNVEGTEYHDPHAVGSLNRILQIWLDMRRDGLQPAAHQLTFTICCRSESRANRVAGFLRRGLECPATDVDQVVRSGHDAWHVSGSAQLALPSLRELERLSTWLRRTSSSHQVRLVRVEVRPAA